MSIIAIEETPKKPFEIFYDRATRIVGSMKIGPSFPLPVERICVEMPFGSDSFGRSWTTLTVMLRTPDSSDKTGEKAPILVKHQTTIWNNGPPIEQQIWDFLLVSCKHEMGEALWFGDERPFYPEHK